MHGFRLSHAGVVLEHELPGFPDSSASLVIDPGNFSDAAEIDLAIDSAAPVVGLVITHEHADHWTPQHVERVRSAAPSAPIYTTAATAAALTDLGFEGVTVVAEADRFEAGPFALEFYGGRHEVLHSSIPTIDNIGVRVNGTFAYGGDALTRPPFAADLLGVPIGSPWSNISQVMDFVLNARPRRAYLTHDGMLSAAGLGLFTTRVRWCLEQVGGELLELPRLTPDAMDARVAI